MIRRIAPLVLSIAALALVGCDDDSHHRTHVHSSGHSNHYKPGDGGIELRGDKVVIRAGGTTEDARVAADGSLAIGRTEVAISAAGQAALKQYDADAVAISDHAIELGKAGAAFGWRTVKEIVHGLLNGTAEEAGKHADEGAKALSDSALSLCEKVRSMYTAQEAAAAEIAEFKPYAVISKRQSDQCLSTVSHDVDDEDHHRRYHHHHRDHDDSDDGDDDGDDGDHDQDSDRPGRKST